METLYRCVQPAPLANKNRNYYWANTSEREGYIQKNNGNHFIYGVAWMTYKAPNGVTGTIYTEAIPVTRNNPNGYASATPNA